MDLSALSVTLLFGSLIQTEHAQEQYYAVLGVEPNWTEIFSGETVTLRCVCSGGRVTDWIYHWYSGHTQPYESNENYYIISAIKTHHSQKYRCYCVEKYYRLPSAWSNEVTLTVIERPKASLTLDPGGQMFIEETVTLRCDVQKHTDTEWSYSWFYSGHPVYNLSKSREFSFSVKVPFSGKYTCRGQRRSDSQKSKISNAVTLTVSEKPKPELTSSCKGPAVRGQPVVLFCELGQSAGWTFYWSKHTHNPENEISTETHSYTISSVSDSDGGQYWCRAGRGNPLYFTHYSDALWVKVTERPKASLTLDPSAQMFIGETLTLRCDVQNHTDTEWSYSWFNNDHSVYNLSESRELSFSVNVSVIGNYTCRGQRRSDSQLSEISDSVTLTVSEKPKPELTSSRKGPALRRQSMVLFCELGQSAGWTFYWSKHTHNPENEISTETHSYTISSVSDSDGGQYWCRAGRGNPLYFTHYSDTLWVNVTERPKASLTLDPGGQMFIEETVTLRCDVQKHTDTEWSYSWFKNGHLVYTLSKSRGFSFSVKVPFSGKYTCRGQRRSDSQKSEISDAVTLTVSEKPKPELTSSRKGPAVRGQSVVLFCELGQSAGWTFYWSKHTHNPENEISTETHSYTISSVSDSDGGQYWCRAGRGNPLYFTHYSDALWVNVTERPKASLTLDPSAQMFIGETVTLRCDVQNHTDTEWSYSWFKNNHSVYNLSESRELSFSVNVSVIGNYTCRGQRRSDSQRSKISDAVTLTVSEKPKPELTSSRKGPAVRGQPVVLFCELGQSAGWMFYWSKHTHNPENETCTETHSYTISSVSGSDGGQYWCRAGRGNPLYFTHYSDALWVNVTGVSSRVSLVVSPNRTQHFSTDSLSLSCEGQRDSTGWRVRRYTHSEKVSDCSSVTGSTCNISSLSSSHTGVYWCESESGESSNPLKITVHYGSVILESPVHPVNEGESLTLRCLYRDTKPSVLTADFYKDGSLLQNQTTAEMTIHTVSQSDEGLYHCKHSQKGESPKSWVSVRGETESSSIISVLSVLSSVMAVSPYLLVSIVLGVKCYRARVFVSLIQTEHAQEQYDAVLGLETNWTEIFSGEKVTFRCVCPGTDGRYQWYRANNHLYESTENIYTLSVIKTNDSQKYQCCCGGKNSARSNEVTLTVIERPKASLTLDPSAQMFIEETVTLRCDVQNHTDTEWNYSWFNNDHPVYNLSESRELSFSVNVSVIGNYTCRGQRRSDSQRSKISDAVTLTVSEKPKPEFTSSRKGPAVRGQPVVLFCELGQSAGWMFYWSKHTHNPENEISTETRSYTISSVSDSDGGQYWCRAGRGNPPYFTHYSDALWVNVTGVSPPVSLMVSPNRTQHFSTDSLSLSCEGQRDSTGWRVSRHTHSEKVSDCSSVTGSTCNISSLNTSHTGVYWCESESGESSNPLNITVHNGAVILESPVHPVIEGDSLTLRCLYRDTQPSVLTADFYKNGSLLQNQTTAEMTIHNVSQSDEGLYHCKHSQKGESPKSWVSVRAAEFAPDLVVAAVGGSFCLLFIIFLILLWRYKTNKDAVSGSMDVTYAQIELKPRKKPKDKQDETSVNADTVYSELKQNTDNDAVSGSMDVTYAQIELKPRKKPKYKQDETSVNADTVYSELKQNTDNVCCYWDTMDLSALSVTLLFVSLIQTERAQEQYHAVLGVEPNWTEIFSGETVTFRCVCPGGRVTDWIYYWYSGQTQLYKSTENIYIISAIKTHHIQKYHCNCVGKNSPLRSARSNEVTLTVIERPKASLTLDPSAQMFIGETVTLRCDVQEHTDTEWSYSWFNNDHPVYNLSKSRELSFSVNVSVSGNYTCRGQRRSDSQRSKISDAVTLTVSEKPKPELTSSRKGPAVRGQPVVLFCELGQSAGWMFYWSKHTHNPENEISTETHSYTISSVSDSDGGQYWCRAGRGNPLYFTHYSDALWVNVTGVSPRVSLVVSPNRTQHFSTDSLSLSCEGQRNSTGWRVRRHTHSEKMLDCSSVTGSTCNISSLSSSHTGVYWCESESGESSNPLNITLHYGSVILESPVHPVTEGESLTLRCLYRDTKPSQLISIKMDPSSRPRLQQRLPSTLSHSQMKVSTTVNTHRKEIHQRAGSQSELKPMMIKVSLLSQKSENLKEELSVERTSSLCLKFIQMSFRD
ncbi:basement membrane-specific heparan sulfate proteoglycan core protein-like [Hoplias malabaricus]|uniref:basement membrane-specific heparan sulfate proteoglycan core protein-like n=1 Tax=Hoplias malabaricus TaxID=27720 RepID=UPI003461923A